ncbi:hypothetical protein OIU84_026053 [Salix udensis]|uniref:Uncharacterized protein n=1 Tax=Salix udensis TaxID=889485 RepID=A0AAD6KMX9_9ROSI|nr:hypothetical protein OIU84_026053 [Salix udensis]
MAIQSSHRHGNTAQPTPQISDGSLSAGLHLFSSPLLLQLLP